MFSDTATLSAMLLILEECATAQPNPPVNRLRFE